MFKKVWVELGRLVGGHSDISSNSCIKFSKLKKNVRLKFKTRNQNTYRGKQRDINLGSNFLNMTLKSQAIKAKIDKQHLQQMKRHHARKNTEQRDSRQGKTKGLKITHPTRV